MVRSYKKKTDRKLPSPRKIRKGLELLKSGYSLRIAAKESGLNYGTLHRVNKKQNNLIGADNDLTNEPIKLSHSSRSVFSEKLEESLAEYCKELSLMGYGLSGPKVCELAYELAVENQKIDPNLKYPSSWDKTKKAGEDWFSGFMKRHPTLSIRTPEGCSLARAAAFNQATVSTFYDKLLACLQRHPNFADGSRMGNLDETANSTVQNTRKVVSPKGIKQVHQIKTAERGVTVTTCCIVTALGSIIPPVMIFPRKKFVSSMMINAYPGSLGLANEKGYMTKETFVQVIKHVIKFTSASKDNPFLLLVDNVETHFSLESLTLAKENGLTILTFPPHCTHKLQPLDLFLFSPFKKYYDDAISSWLLQNPGQSVTIYHIAGFVKTALLKSGTVQNITAGFAKAGIMPFDRNIFPESEFIMASVTHQVDPTSHVEVLALVPAEPENNSTMDTDDTQTVDNIILDSIIFEEEATPQLSTTAEPEPSATGSQAVRKSPTLISPKELRGLPKAKTTTRKPRRNGKCCIVTDTPEKNEVEERERAREEKLKKIEENKRKREDKKAQKGKGKKKVEKRTVRTLVYSEESDNSDTVDNDILNKSDDVNLTVPPTPTEGDFILVVFPAKENVHYVGKVIKDVDGDGDLEVSFYRLSSKMKDRFVLPNVPDLCSVSIDHVKEVLPKPNVGKTKRQQSTLGFDFNFANFKMG